MFPFRRPPSILSPRSISRLTSQYSLLRPQPARQFHASPRRHAFGDTILAVPHDLLLGLHSTGLPWAAVIPITAIAIRCIVVPLLIAPAHRERAKIAELAPLVSANALLVREKTEQIMKENPEVLLKKSPQVLYKDGVKAIRASLGKDFSVNRRTVFRTLYQIPIFLLFAETLRRMMGMRGWGRNAAKDADQSTLPSAGGETAPLQTDVALPEITSWYEPSLTTEGPFSIMDLTIPDPTLCLPVMVSVLMIANLRYGNYRRQDMVKSTISRRLHNGMLGIAFLMFPFTMHLPAGFLYYWACTSASSLTADVLIDRLVPPRPIIRPCRRPLPSITKKAR